MIRVLVGLCALVHTVATPLLALSGLFVLLGVSGSSALLVSGWLMTGVYVLYRRWK